MHFNFSEVLLAALTPVTLISGVGLLLLSMTNRYNHATNRIRELLREKSCNTDPRIDPDIDEAVELIFKRCWYLRRAMLFMAISVTFSGLIVLANVLASMFGWPLDIFQCILLVLGLGFAIVSLGYFVLEISTSMHALDMTVHYGKERFHCVHTHHSHCQAA